jgi:transcriptional regulator with XRE-family HTH domain
MPMSRNEKSYIEGDRPTAAYMSKQEFGRRLYALMIAKGLRQADLARITGLSRNNISTYVNGKCFPSPLTLKLLATALGTEPEKILPNITKHALGSERHPGFSLQSSPADPDKGWLTVNMLVPMDVGAKISQLLFRHGETDEPS